MRFFFIIRKLFIIPLILLMLFIYLPGEIKSLEGDLDGDGAEEKIIFFSKLNKKYLSIYRGESKVFSKDITRLDPQWIKLCEIDGKSPMEIFVSAKKSTPLHEEVIERPFFLQFDGEKLIRKWTGSTFGREYKALYFFDLNNDGKDEIYTVDILENGKEKIAMHYWFLFGFINGGESREYDEINFLEEGDGGLRVNYREGETVIERRIEWEEDRENKI